MRTAIDMLTQMDYEVAGIGENTVPATILEGGRPIGFLMPDFSVSLLPEHADKLPAMEKAVDFSLEYQDMSGLGDEFLLTQYRNVALTADYDFETQAPIYNIYERKDGENILLHSAYDKDEATRDYAARSGLTPGAVANEPPNNDRMNRFIAAIQQHGYAVSDKVREASRAYELVDKNGRLVGYIDKVNRITLATDNPRTRRFFTNAYRDSGVQQPSLPSFFATLRERLASIGLSLKQLFSRGGGEYAIQDKGHNIAYVTPDREVQYTGQATDERMRQIDAMIAQTERENAERSAPQPQPEQTAQNVAPEQAQRALSPLELAAADSFAQYQQLLSTVRGFNGTRAEQATQDMTARFGTADPKEFAQRLQRGDYAEPKNLVDRLRQGKERAAAENARNARPVERAQAAPAQEH